MGFWSSVKGALSRFVSKGSSVSITGGGDGLDSSWGLTSAYLPTRGPRRWVQTYKNHPVLGPIIWRISEDVAKGDYRLYRIEGEGHDGRPLLKVIQQHPFVDLWNNPNPDMTGREFRKLGLEWLECCGMWPNWIAERDGNGNPVTVYPIEPWAVILWPTRRRPRWVFRWKGETITAWAWDMVFLRYIDPEMPYELRGQSPAQRVASDVATIEYAARWNLNLFRQGANPGKLVALPGGKDLAVAAKEKFLAEHTGIENSHKPFFVAAGASEKGKVQVLDLMRSHSELEFIPGMKFARDRCCQNWNFSPVILGDTGDSSHGNPDTEIHLYEEACLDSKMGFLAEQFTRQLLGEFEDSEDLVLGYISPVRESKQFMLDQANSQLSRGAATIDEYRHSQGGRPLGGELGECVPIPVNTILVRRDMTVEQIQEMLLARSGKGPSQAEPTTHPGDNRDVSGKGLGRFHQSVQHVVTRRDGSRANGRVRY